MEVLLGQQVLGKTFNNRRDIDLNISKFKTGIYIMKVNSIINKIVTDEII